MRASESASQLLQPGARASRSALQLVFRFYFPSRKFVLPQAARVLDVNVCGAKQCGFL